MLGLRSLGLGWVLLHGVRACVLSCWKYLPFPCIRIATGFLPPTVSLFYAAFLPHFPANVMFPFLIGLQLILPSISFLTCPTCKIYLPPFLFFLYPGHDQIKLLHVLWPNAYFSWLHSRGLMYICMIFLFLCIQCEKIIFKSCWISCMKTCSHCKWIRA